MWYLKIIKTIILMLAALVAMPVMSASLQVSPIMLDINQSQPSDGIWLQNTGNGPLQAQVRVFSWNQHNKQDRLESTSDFVASPPLIKVEPGQRQFVRLVRIGNLSNKQEQAYRIVVDELPFESEVDEGLTFVLRYSIPVFIQGQEESLAPVLSWYIVQDSEKKVLLVVTNSGNTRAQLSRLSFTQANGKTTMLNDGLVGYALANSTNQFVISPNAQSFSSGGVFNVFVNGIEQQVSVSGL